MPAIHVDRLTLELSGLSEPDGRRLAHLIAEALAAADSQAGPAVQRALRVRLDHRAGESMDSLARRVAADILGQLDHRAWEGSR